MCAVTRTASVSRALPVQPTTYAREGGASTGGGGWPPVGEQVAGVGAVLQVRRCRLVRVEVAEAWSLLTCAQATGAIAEGHGCS